MKKQETKYKAIKYIRLSQADDNAGESDSIANQRRIIDDFLKKHPEIEVVGEKIDDGWSGIIFDRPSFNEMMDEFKEGRANCCVTKDLSRLGREYISTGRYLRSIFPALGVRFIAINDSIDTLTDSGDDLVVSLKSIINDSYCQDTSIKTRSALAAKRANGEFVGAFAAYGYKRSEQNRNLLVIDEYAAEIVREIFSMALDGFASSRIASALNERGVLSPIQHKKKHGQPYAKNGYGDKDSAKWSPTTIIRMLKDEVYTGVLIQGMYSTPNYKLQTVFVKPLDECVRVENTHEAIIKKNDYDMVQKILLNESRTPPNGDMAYNFSGIVTCGRCGNPMYHKGNPDNETEYHYLLCKTTKKQGCRMPMLRLEKFTELVLAQVKLYVQAVTSLDHAIANLDSDEFTLRLKKHLNSQVNENIRKLKEIREYEAGIDEGLLKGNLTKREHELMKADYDKKVNVLIGDNERLQREINDTLSFRREKTEWMEHFRQFANISSLDRRSVINLIQNIKIKSITDFEITFHFQQEYEATLSLIKQIGMEGM